jgi:hypothetical protein
VDKFMKYAENRRKYLADMHKWYTRMGDTSNSKRCEREMETLEASVVKAMTRSVRYAGEVC